MMGFEEVWAAVNERGPNEGPPSLLSDVLLKIGGYASILNGVNSPLENQTLIFMRNVLKNLRYIGDENETIANLGLHWTPGDIEFKRGEE